MFSFGHASAEITSRVIGLSCLVAHFQGENGLLWYRDDISHLNRVMTSESGFATKNQNGNPTVEMINHVDDYNAPKKSFVSERRTSRCSFSC